MSESSDAISIRAVADADLSALDALEQSCFSSDRLSRRRLRHWIHADNRVFLVAWRGGVLLGYALVLLRRGTRLARLYSLAVAPAARGLGLGRLLLGEAEAASSASGRFFMRLEVAEGNRPAIALYERLGYHVFGRYPDYYQDHASALRMHKRIRYRAQNLFSVAVPWYGQTTDFTCGPAAAMMAMAALDPAYRPSVSEELAIWREATTIFMTSGHGGCHPIGLALALLARGFGAEVYLNQSRALFIAGVRTPGKKAVLEQVDHDFRSEAARRGLPLHRGEVKPLQLQEALANGSVALLLVSTYRLDGKKVPHWVTLSGMDSECLYVNDPDADEIWNALDSTDMPIAREDFARMSVFCRERLSAAVIVHGRGAGSLG